MLPSHFFPSEFNVKPPLHVHVSVPPIRAQVSLHVLANDESQPTSTVKRELKQFHDIGYKIIHAEIHYFILTCWNIFFYLKA